MPSSILGVLLFIPSTLFLGYRILDEIEFCDSKQPSICESKTASNSTSGKLVFDVDLKERLFNGVGDVNYNGYRSELPVKIQREDCYCDWRYCNGCDKIRLKLYIMAISVLCKFILREYLLLNGSLL